MLASTGRGGALFYASRWDLDFGGAADHGAWLLVTDEAVKPGLGWDMPTVLGACDRRDVLIEGTVLVLPPETARPTLAPEGLVQITRVVSLHGDPMTWRPDAFRRSLHGGEP